MRIQRDNFLIHIDDAVQRSRIMSSDGKPLNIDLDFNPKEHKKQVGVIVALPVTMSEQYNSDLKEGDRVLVSHQIAEEDHRLDKDLYRAEYFNIFAKINKEVEPIEDFIFCNEMKELRESVLDGAERISTKYATVVATSQKAKEVGVIIGDVIHFTHNADYRIVVGPKEFIRMRVRNIIGIERKGELVPIKGRILVKEVIEKKFIAGIEVVPEPSPQKFGVALSGDLIGKKICYFNGHNTLLIWKGDRYSFLTNDHLKYIV